MQTITFEELMTTPVDEFAEDGVTTGGLTARQCGALVMGARINECGTITELVLFHQEHNGFSGDVKSSRDLRSFVNFHMARVADQRRADQLVRAEEQVEIARTRSEAQLNTPARSDFIKTVSTMASELDEVVPGANVVSHIQAAQMDFSIDSTTQAWWAQLRRRIIGIASTVEGTEFGPELSRALNGPDTGTDGAEALAEVTGNSLDQFMGGSSAESDA